MSSIGAVWPVHNSNATAAWRTSIPRPSRVDAPRARAACSSGVSSGDMTMSATSCSGASHRASTGRERPSMPTEVALTTSSASATSAGSPTRPAVPASAAAPAALDGGAVDHDDLGRAGVGQAQDEGPRRTPAAQHRAASSGHREAGIRGQRGHEPGAVGVVTHQPVALGHHAVDRPQPTGRLGQLAPRCGVEVIGHRRLVGHGHRQPGQRQGAHGLHRCLCPALGHLEGDVHPVQASGLERGVEDLGRARMSDRIADHGRHPGRAGGRDHPPSTHPPNSPSALALAVARWKSL